MNRPARCLLAFFFTLIMFIGCEENEHNGFIQDNQKDTITGILTNYTGCKYFKFTGISDTLSCINYQYNESQHQLSLKHINAGFNCCPDSLYAFITIIKDTVIIKEHERMPSCKCNCLFDLDFELNNIKPSLYQIKIVEPYAVGMENMLFKIDLSNTDSGSYCVTRKKYPWGNYAMQQ